MRILEGIVNDHEITIMVDNEWKPCYLKIRLVQPVELVLIDDDFPNARMLSASLSCRIGYGPACDFLHAHGVPKESQLWNLNHEGWAPPVKESVEKVVIAKEKGGPEGPPL